MYLMTELASIQVPDSLESFSRLLSVEVLNTLVRINALLIKIKESKDIPPIQPDKKRKTLTTPERNKIFDKSRNRYRQTPMLF